jgi:multidrug efflux pump subunit AcrA (membrane-fusion protein)
MNKGMLTGVIILGLALIGAAIFSMQMVRQKNALSAELQSVKTELAYTKDELSSTNASLVNTQSDLASTKSTLAATQSELSTIKNTLTSTQTTLNTTNTTLAVKLLELNTANDKYAVAQSSLSSAQNNLSSTQKKLSAAQDTLSGLGITVASSVECYDVTLTDNPSAKNPTWQQLKDFLAKDKTENHAYIESVYDCSQFSQTLHDNAEAAGIRAAEVDITFQGERVGHALNAFITSDYGLVYVDCTGTPDKIDNLISGKELRSVETGWMVSPANIRNQAWWDSLGSYYYMRGNSGGHCITSKINFYW